MPAPSGVIGMTNPRAVTRLEPPTQLDCVVGPILDLKIDQYVGQPRRRRSFVGLSEPPPKASLATSNLELLGTGGRLSGCVGDPEDSCGCEGSLSPPTSGCPEFGAGQIEVEIVEMS